MTPHALLAFLYKYIITIFLILALIVPASMALMPDPVEAAGGGAGGVGGAALGGFSACASKYIVGMLFVLPDKAQGAAAVPNAPQQDKTTGARTGETFEKFFTDCFEHEFALEAGKYLLAQMTNEIVSYIQSGFNKQPAFVSDPGQFFKDIGDNLAGSFIEGTDLAFLCSPFKLQVKIALALNYASSFSQRSQCTLSQIFNNVNGAFSDFNSGGWAGFLAISQNNQNNPYGSYLEASGGLNARIEGAKSLELTKLNWGNGFLSYDSCDDGTVLYGGVNISGTGDGDHGSCSTKTPGTVIQDQLKTALGEPIVQLGIDDDLDKIFNALADELFKSVFSGKDGLLGSGGVNGSRTSAKVSDRSGYITGQVGAGGTYVDSQVQGANDTISAAGNNGNSGQANLAPQGTAVQSGGRPGGGCGPQEARTGNSAAGKANVDQSGGCSGVSIVGPGPSGYAWWSDDLGKTQTIGKIVLFPRTDSGTHTPTASTFKVFISTTPPTAGLDPNNPPPGVVWTSSQQTMGHINPVVIPVTPTVDGQFVWVVDTTKDQWLELTQVQVFGAGNNTKGGGGIGTLYPPDSGGGSSGGGGYPPPPGPIVVGPVSGNPVSATPSNLQSVIDNAPAGSKIELTNGTYGGFHLKSGINIEGQSGGTTINGSVILESSTRLSSMVFDNASIQVADNATDVTIDSARFQNITGRAISFNNVNNLQIINNKFLNIRSQGNGSVGGHNITNSTISQNSFDHNTESLHFIWGGTAISPDNVYITRNIFTAPGHYTFEMQSDPGNRPFHLDISKNWVGNWDDTFRLADNGLYNTTMSIATGHAVDLKVHDNVFGPAPQDSIAGPSQQGASHPFEIMGTNAEVYNNKTYGSWNKWALAGCLESSWSVHDNIHYGASNTSDANGVLPEYCASGFQTGTYTNNSFQPGTVAPDATAWTSQ